MQVKFNKGDMIMLMALSLWIFYTIVVKKNTMPPFTLIAASAVVSSVILAPFAIYQGFDMNSISFPTVIAILYIGIFVSAVSFIFWSIGLRDVGAARAGIFLNLIPVFTAIVSVMMGGQITTSQIMGGILVFSGVFFTTGVWQRKTKEG